VKLKPATTLQPETEQTEPGELPVRTIHESIFWDSDSPNWSLTGLGESAPANHSTGSHVLDMGADSYIWCFTGGRGGGKTTLMTFFAMKVNYLYGYRIIANYPIEYTLNLVNGTSRLVQSEPLDLYRLLCFDSDYRNCLILIDEAPDIISHLASMSWKNRLLNIFIRQLRKNHNSLFLAAQQFETIDKSMRWQTDILAECKDASRKYGWAASERGKCILCRLLDNSGMWTGKTYQQAMDYNKAHGRYEDPGLKLQVFPRCLWADNGCKPVYDSYYQQDVWESLRKVDMKLMSFEVGKKQEAADPATLAYVKQSIPVINSLIESEPLCYTKYFYASLGALTPKDKDALSKRMNEFGVAVGQDGNGKRYYDFSKFDIQGFSGGGG